MAPNHQAPEGRQFIASRVRPRRKRNRSACDDRRRWFVSTRLSFSRKTIVVTGECPLRDRFFCRVRWRGCSRRLTLASRAKLGTISARAGHEVVFGYARSEQKLKKLARDANCDAGFRDEWLLVYNRHVWLERLAAGDRRSLGRHSSASAGTSRQKYPSDEPGDRSDEGCSAARFNERFLGE